MRPREIQESPSRLSIEVSARDVVISSRGAAALGLEVRCVEGPLHLHLNLHLHLHLHWYLPVSGGEMCCP